ADGERCARRADLGLLRVEHHGGVRRGRERDLLLEIVEFQLVTLGGADLALVHGVDRRLGRGAVLAVVERADDVRLAHIAMVERHQHLVADLRHEVAARAAARHLVGDARPGLEARQPRELQLYARLAVAIDVIQDLAYGDAVDFLLRLLRLELLRQTELHRFARHVALLERNPHRYCALVSERDRTEPDLLARFEAGAKAAVVDRVRHPGGAIKPAELLARALDAQDVADAHTRLTDDGAGGREAL